MPQLAVDGVVVRAKDIPSYCTDEFFQILAYWQMAKTMGMPNGSVGWANEPSLFVEAYVALESEENLMQQEQMKKQEEEAKRKQSKKGGHGRRR